MAVTPDSRHWADLFADRTRNDAGDGIAVILGFLGNPELISFAGGFPDPATFPAERTAAILQDLASAGEVSAFQYAPTRGLAGPRDAIASRIESLQGARPGDDELLITSGGIEALELVSKSFLDKGDIVVVEGPTYLGAIMAFRNYEADVQSPCLSTTTDSTSTTSRRDSPPACARSFSTRSPITRTRPA